MSNISTLAKGLCTWLDMAGSIWYKPGMEKTRRYVAIILSLFALSTSAFDEEEPDEGKKLTECSRLLGAVSKLASVTNYPADFSETLTTEHGTFLVQTYFQDRVVSLNPLIGMAVQGMSNKERDEGRAPAGLTNLEFVFGGFSTDVDMRVPLQKSTWGSTGTRWDLGQRTSSNQFKAHGFEGYGHWAALSSDRTWAAVVKTYKQKWMLQLTNLKTGRSPKAVKLADLRNEEIESFCLDSTCSGHRVGFGWAGTDNWVEVAFLENTDLVAVMIRNSYYKKLKVIKVGENPKVLFNSRMRGLEDISSASFPVLHSFDRGLIVWDVGRKKKKDPTRIKILKITASDDEKVPLNISKGVLHGKKLASSSKDGRTLAVIRQPLTRYPDISPSELWKYGISPAEAVGQLRDEVALYEEEGVGRFVEKDTLLSNYDWVESFEYSASGNFIAAVVSKSNKYDETLVDVSRHVLLIDAVSHEVLVGPYRVHVDYGAKPQLFTLQPYGENSFLLLTYYVAPPTILVDSDRHEGRTPPQTTIEAYLIHSDEKRIEKQPLPIEFAGSAGSVFVVEEGGPRFFVIDNDGSFAFTVRPDENGAETFQEAAPPAILVGQ